MEEQIKLESLIKVWDRTIDVQKHFNELEFKIKQFAISLSSLILGGVFALVITGKIPTTKIFNEVEIHILSVGFYFTAVIWFIFWLVDRHWYHNFLKGAVIEAVELEQIISGYIPISGLSTTIGKHSSGSKYMPNSNKRLFIFYWSIILSLVGTGYIVG